MFTCLMTAEPRRVEHSIALVATRIMANSCSRALTPNEHLALRLNAEYPGDVGILSSFFLNLVRPS